MIDNSSGLLFLKDEVARTFGSRLETATDFDALSESIEAGIGALISPSTLKRLWGYVRPQTKPRMSTLDLLAKYCGRDNYASLCTELRDSSAFITTSRTDSAALLPGAEVMLQWLPDRTVLVRYLGDRRFRVLDGGSSKLKEGDEFEATSFLVGHPLYIDFIVRDGKPLPPYVAGRSGGLTGINVK